MGYEPLSSVTAVLRVWRVFGLNRQFLDAPQDAAVSWSAGLPLSDRVTVTIGEMPAEAAADVRAYASGSLDALVWLFKGRRPLPEDHGSSLQAAADKAESDVRGSFRTFVSILIERDLPLTTDAEGNIEAGLELDSIDRFAKEGLSMLEETTGRIVATFQEALPLTRIVYGRNARVFVQLPGKPSFALPEISGSLNASVECEGWVEINRRGSNGFLAGVGTKSKPAAYTSSAAHWLSAALAEPDDPLRRFMFAYLGLEVMIHKVTKVIEDRAIDKLAATTRLPMRQLVWPSESNADRPWRNIVFRFAVMAAHLSAASAEKDVESFRLLTRKRNDMAHGNARADDVDRLPANGAVELLARYIAIVYEGDAKGLL